MDQNTPSSPAPIDYWHMILRRKWLALVIFLACVGSAAILCIVLPESYRSSTLILVESQKIPENYVQALVGPSIEARLNSIQQQVMSRTLLTQMIQEFDLYPNLVRQNGIEAVVERLRKDILVTTNVTHSSRGGIDAFSISFAHDNPLLAMKVTAKLASQFIDENLRVREQLVEGASEFLEQELSMAKERLETQERSISLFKTKYMGELPGQVQANISALDRLQLHQSTSIEALQKALDRLALIEKSLKEYESTGTTTTGTVMGPVGAVRVDPLLERLKDLENTLAKLSSEYKDNYPDIVQLKQEIQTLKTKLGNRAAKTDGSEKATASATVVHPLDAYLRELTRQREEAKLDIPSLKDRLARIKEQIKEYETRVEKAPVREQELMILLRDYDNLKENYRSLLDKKLNARLSENLEKRQKGEQFRIVDPANVPGKPEKPDRFKIMLIGLALGCGLGIGSAVVLESSQSVFRRSNDVESLLQLRVLASIPNFRSILGQTNKLLPGRTMNSPSAGAIKGRLLSARIPEVKLNGELDSKSATHIAGLPALKTKRSSGQTSTSRELDLIVKWSPASVVAEQFRVAATRLALLQSARRGNVTVITSAIKGEGKSAVTANLAYVLAHDMGKLTLLVDADLKCPTIHQYMGTPQFPGLRDVLQEQHSVESCLHREGELPLWILPSGGESGRTLGLSKVNQIAGIIADLKGRYDYILIDAPPILPLADMHVLAGMADTLALVIRAGLTPRSVVENAIRTLNATSNTCIILNGLESAGVPYYMAEGYDYLLQKKEAGPT